MPTTSSCRHRLVLCVIACSVFGFMQALVACGGPSATRSPLDPVPIVPAAPPMQRSLCPWDLEAMVERGVEAWYVTPPLVGGVLAWTAEPAVGEQSLADESEGVSERAIMEVASGDGVVRFEATFELRDDRGLQTGREFWQCDEAGLALRAIETPTRQVRFEPPLTVLPSVGERGELHGQLVFQQDGVETRMAWVWSWAAVPGQPIGHFDAPGASWRTIASVLQAADELGSYEWLTTTTWLIESDLVIPALRTQRLRISDMQQERTEQLDRLVNR